MKEGQLYSDTVKSMSSKEFRRLSEFIVDHCGIKMPPAKKIMLESRLQKTADAGYGYVQRPDYVLGSAEG
jgi:hypothetical protein